MTTAVYGKLSKPEVGGTGLVVQSGALTYSSAAATTVNLTTPIKTVLYGGFTPGPSATLVSSVPRLTTLTVAAGVLAVAKAAGAAVKNWTYILVGY